MARWKRSGVAMGAVVALAIACGGKDGSEGDGSGGVGTAGVGTGGAPTGGQTTGGRTTGGQATGDRSSGGAPTGGSGTGGSLAGSGGIAGAPLGGGGGAAASAGTASGGGPTGGATTGGSGTSGAGTGGSVTGGTGGATPGGSGTSGAGTAGSAGTAGTAGAAGSAPTAACVFGTVVCDDGLGCNGVETCAPGAAGADPDSGCVQGTPVVCPSDGIDCTAEICSPTTDTCVSVPQDVACIDGRFCNGTETCVPGDPSADATTGCVAGTTITCNDSATCTTDACDDDLDTCTYTPVAAECGDAFFCNGEETCAPGTAGAHAATGCVAGAEPCPVDAVGCTLDGCDEDADACTHAPVNADCADDSTCNGTESCDPALGCAAGDPVDCADDGASCTVEGCEEPGGTCTVTVDPTVCGTDFVCEPANPGADPATGCVAKGCAEDADCLDANACNGVEYCDTTALPATCKLSAPAVDCSDGKTCTTDTCDPGTGACTNVPIDGHCLDTNQCNGVEVCDPGAAGANAATGCVAGTAPNCDDGKSCTNDFCSFALGCVHSPTHALCGDGQVCNGTEQCVPAAPGANAATGCIAGTALTCPDDGVACTVNACVESAGGCVAAPDHDLCPCGQTCDPTGGCGNYCTVTACLGKVYQCGDCADNDGDCKIDSFDTACLGVCDNAEDRFKGNIPGQNNAPCKSDCYFDGDSGSGNDECEWNHKCDPLSVAPSYPPEGRKCEYAPSSTCDGWYASQPLACWDDSATPASGDNYCGALVPNGCDCFGCCSFPGIAWDSWVGSVDASDVGSCTPEVLASTTLTVAQKQALCKPCTQVPSCRNTCETCELCLGKTEIPPECTPADQCPGGEQACGLIGQDACPGGYYCVTGCCQLLPS